VLANLLGPRRGIFALHHAKQAHVVDAILDGIQGLDETIEPITFDPKG
jgi:hypothetical protein